MKRLLAVLLAMCLLSGCVASIGDAEMKADGTGHAKVSVGFSKSAIELYNEMAAEEGEEQLDITDATEFTYDGIAFVGTEVEFDFDDPAELADTFNVMQESEDTGAVDLGWFSFEQEGADTLTFIVDTNEYTGEVETEDAEETDPKLQKILDEMRVIYTFNFFGDVSQTAGRRLSAFTVKGNTLVIDYLKLAQENRGDEIFRFTVKGANIPTGKSASFPDVRQGDWFYDPVISMANAGLIKGRASGLFCPQDRMTKAEFLAVVMRAHIGEAHDNLTAGQKGAPWWDKYYTLAESEEIVAAETFPYLAMELPITREEMAQIAYGLILANFADEEYNLFTAAKGIPDFDEVSENFDEAVAYCYADGILKGRDASGKFYPTENLTRAEASTVLSRVYERILG